MNQKTYRFQQDLQTQYEITLVLSKASQFKFQVEKENANLPIVVFRQ